LRSAVGGDALAAGGRVSLQSSVAGDAVVAGGELQLDGEVGQDLYAAGGQIRVNGRVSGGARLAGGDVWVQSDARIDEGLSAAGGRVAVDGTVNGYAQVAGGSIRIDGYVAGDVEAAGGELSVGPTAVIDGTLTFRGPRPATVAPGAKLSGGVVNVTQEWDEWWKAPVLLGVIALVWLVGWAVVGVLLLLLLPGPTRRVTSTVLRRPGGSALTGLIALVLVPVVLTVLALTLIGIPLALLGLLLYLALLPLGYLAGVAAIGDWALARWADPQSRERAGRRVVAFLLTLLIVGILIQIPLLGWLGGMLIWVAGIGALLLVLSGRDFTAPGGPAGPRS
jgi:hypothetical protein